MALRCPACSKPDQTGAACARCGSDLSRLHDLVRASTAAHRAAQTALRHADWRAALERAELSWQLRRTAAAARLAFLAAAALGDTARALRWHSRGG